MSRFEAARPVGLSGTLLSAPASARVGDHSIAAGLIGAAPEGMSPSSLTQEMI